jgi:transposase
MDASTLTVDMPLPTDGGALQDLVRQLLAEVVRLRAENAELRQQLEQANKHRFGRRSERRRLKAATHAANPSRQRDLHGRAPLPAHLERRDVIHDLSEAEKLCPCCGQPRLCIGTQTAEQLEMEPARFFVLRTLKKSYACQHCDPERVPAEQRLQTAGPAQVGPLAKGLCGPGLLAHVLVAKYADHTPLQRLVGQLARWGVTIASSTLGDWVAQAAALLTPLYRLLQQRLLLARVLHSDDTPVKLRVPGADRTHKAHLWVYVGDADYPYTVFDFTTDYTGAGPQQFLQGYQGYLQADALAQYEGLYGVGQAQHVCCWAHARRKFVEAVAGGDERGTAALDWIGQLYAIERELPVLLGPTTQDVTPEQRRQREEQRRQLRHVQARPLLEALRKWLQEQRAQALPKSPLGQAIGYALNNWAALERYLEQGYLAIDNNLSERTLRQIALGRNNWGVLGSARGGASAAVLYSVVGTCRHQGIDPWSYLQEALVGLFALGEGATPEQFAEWLPDRWQQRRSRAGPSAAAG